MAISTHFISVSSGMLGPGSVFVKIAHLQVLRAVVLRFSTLELARLCFGLLLFCFDT